MEKIYEAKWILNNGNLYASTAVEVMLAEPAKRADVVTFWIDRALESNQAWEKDECEFHALAAFLAKEQMGDKVVTEDFPGFFGKKYWWVWMKEQIESNSSKVNWHKSPEKPKFEGEYLVTTLEAQMCSSRGGSSYAYTTTSAIFNGEDWEMSGVLAWTEMPEPYYPTDK